MTISEVKQIFERQFGTDTFPVDADDGLTPVVTMTDNAIYQFAHAVIREHLARQLERAHGPIST